MGRRKAKYSSGSKSQRSKASQSQKKRWAEHKRQNPDEIANNMNINVHKFIEYIQGNPAIWDKTAYQSILAKEASWNNVAENIFPNWSEMTSEESQELIKEIKSKWKNIRDYYTKFKNHNERNDSTKRMKCNYAKYLTFLDNNIPQQRPIKEEEIEEQEDVKLNIGEQQVQKFEEVLLDSPELFEGDKFTEQPSPPPQKLTRIAMQQQSRKRKITIELQRQQPVELKKQKEEVGDPDKSYLLSILPDYKMLSYEEKLDFRMYSLGFFKRMCQKRIRKSSNQ